MLDYSWVPRLAPLASCLIVPVAGIPLIYGDKGTGRLVWGAGLAALFGVLLYFNGLYSGVGLLAAGALFFVPCMLAGLGLGYSLMQIRQRRGRLAVIPFALAVSVITLQVVAAGSVAAFANYYTGWGLAALPPFAGGFMLGSTLRGGHPRRTRYIALWLVVVGTLGMAAYMNHMEGITYAFVAPARMFGPYAPARVTEAVLASMAATVIYVGGSLALLALPFLRDNAPAATRRLPGTV